MYNFIKVVGKGGFGRVWKVELKKTRQVYALKVMSKARVLAKKSVQSVMNERQLLAQIENMYYMAQRSFIVNMLGAFQDRENLYLAMDFLNGGDLRYHLNRKIIFDEKQISTNIATQSSSLSASWRLWSICTPTESFTETSSLKILYLRTVGTVGSQTLAWLESGNSRILPRHLGHRATWRQKSCAGRTTRFALTTSP